MSPFPRPSWDADYPIDVARERAALRAHATLRAIPERTAQKLLVATWNVANVGLQTLDDPQDC